MNFRVSQVKKPKRIFLGLKMTTLSFINLKKIRFGFFV